MDNLWSPWRMTYIQGKKEDGCIFCRAPELDDGLENLILHRGKYSYIIMNRYPYTSGHLMVVPYSHSAGLEQLEPLMRAEIMELTLLATRVLTLTYHPHGFNLGMNLGEAGGAGIAEHLHMHIVPRWNGDTNFMSALANTRVLPESLEDTYQRLRASWTQQNQTTTDQEA